MVGLDILTVHQMNVLNCDNLIKIKSCPFLFADDIVLASFRNKQKQYQAMMQGLQVGFDPFRTCTRRT